jgi:hypothetical protein
MRVAGGDELLPYPYNGALGLCRDEAVSGAVQTIEGAGIAADAPDCGADRVEAGDHLFDRLKARMAQDVGDAESREIFALDPESFAPQFEDHVHHRQHSLDQRHHSARFLHAAGRELRGLRSGHRPP